MISHLLYFFSPASMSGGGWWIQTMKMTTELCLEFALFTSQFQFPSAWRIWMLNHPPSDNFFFMLRGGVMFVAQVMAEMKCLCPVDQLTFKIFAWNAWFFSPKKLIVKDGLLHAVAVICQGKVSTVTSLWRRKMLQRRQIEEAIKWLRWKPFFWR